ncbi:MAG: STAS domain-containing protein [Deltaproteobacteria bacterium]|nr:STAS domain-containing protein [Deltaproteobacteria bacterium]
MRRAFTEDWTGGRRWRSRWRIRGTAPEFEKGLLALMAGGDSTLVLNFNGLEYISSAGLRSILSTAKQLKAKDGKMLFAGLQGPVKDVFKISGFGSIFKIFDTEEEALRQI